MEAAPSAAIPVSAPRAAADLNLIWFAVVFTLLAVALMGVSERLMGDPDTQWHVAVGRWIVDNRAFPTVDTFSHTFAGQPWIAKEWLSQLVLFMAYSAGGWPLVAVLAVACIAGSVAAIAAYLATRLRSTIVIVAVLLGVLMASPMMVARPHILALPLMVGWTLGLLQAVETRQGPPWWLLIVMVAWANAHAGFTIGFVVAGLLALEAVRDAGRDGWLRAGVLWGAFLLLALAASCVTPYGAGAYIVTLGLFGSGEPLPFIDEWRPLAFDMVGGTTMVTLAVLLVALARWPVTNITRIALVAIIAFMAVRYSRFGLVAAFVALPVALAALAQRLAGIGPEPAGGGRISRALVLVPCVLALAAALLLAPRPQTGDLATPREALAAALAAGLSGPVYNSYSFGGHLIFAGIPTFIDGRTDQLFLGGFFAGLEAASTARDPEAFRRLMARHGVTWAIVQAGAPERQHFAAMGWRVLHRDGIAEVYAKP